MTHDWIEHKNAMLKLREDGKVSVMSAEGFRILELNSLSEEVQEQLKNALHNEVSDG